MNQSFLSSILKSRIWASLWSVFVRLFIMLGLPLLGWGAADIRGFFEHPARVGIAALAFVIAAQSGIAVYRVPVLGKGSPHDEEHWHYSLLEIVFILSAYGDRRNVLTWDENIALRWVGVGIYLLGVIYTVWANWTWVNHLRREGASARKHPALIDEGPFAWTRYPIMTALLCYHIGFTLTFRSWIGAAFTLPILYLVIRRMNIWDRELAGKHSIEWRGREQRVKRMIPFLY